MVGHPLSKREVVGSNPTGGFLCGFALGCTCKLACRVQRGGQCVVASPRVDFKISGLCALGLHHPAVAFPPSSAAFPLLSTLRPPPSCSAGRQGLGTIAMRFQTRQAWLATCGRWCAWPIIWWRCNIHVFGKDEGIGAHEFLSGSREPHGAVADQGRPLKSALRHCLFRWRR